MTRRGFLFTSAAAAFAAAPRTKMGICATSYSAATRPKDTLAFIEHCHSLGAGGVQAPLTSTEASYIFSVRRKLEEYGMFYEVMLPMPHRETDSAALDATCKGAKEAGAVAARTACLSGRRYETFKTKADWENFVGNSEQAIARMAKIADRHKLAIGIENHKDWTAGELAEKMRRYSSEYLGVCLDTGNSISLLEDSQEVIDTLAPWAVTTHIKDMAVGEYKDGFLLSEVPLGQGFLDLPRAIGAIHKARPKTTFVLEMITRDPSQVPVWTPNYWLTFEDRKATALARTMMAVKSGRSIAPPLYATGKSPEELKVVEAKNIEACLHYFRDKLEPAV